MWSLLRPANELCCLAEALTSIHDWHSARGREASAVSPVQWRHSPAARRPSDNSLEVHEDEVEVGPWVVLQLLFELDYSFGPVPCCDSVALECSEQAYQHFEVDVVVCRQNVWVLRLTTRPFVSLAAHKRSTDLLQPESAVGDLGPYLP